MNRTGKLSLFNPAFVLRLIRDSKARTWEEILAHVGLPQIAPRLDRHTGRLGVNSSFAVLEKILSDLIDAGFITVEKDLFIPTPLVGKVQTALDISLSELSKLQGDCILAVPFFGLPKPLYLTPDVIPDVFVLMPFSEELKPVYEDHIRIVLAKLELKAMRADDIFATGPIIDDVWSLI